MWADPGQDPGGPGGSEPPPNQELIDLKDQFDQQQLLIAQLKEMLRKTDQTSITQEKVEEYANTLTKMNARAKKGKLKEGLPNETNITYSIDTPAKEKMNLLRQQFEANKAKLAERGRNQKGIEEIVTQLKAQLDDSQQLISQTPLNLSVIETTKENYSLESSSQELYDILLHKEKIIVELYNKVHKLEANILDLQENVREKDSVIDARTKAITLMSENLSNKRKSTLDALDDTKEQMRKMQENFITFETEMKMEKQKLVIDLEEKNNELIILQSRNDKLLGENKLLQNQVDEFAQKLEEFEMKAHETSDITEIIDLESINIPQSKIFEEKQTQNLEYTIKISELENTISELNSTISDLKSTDIHLDNKEMLKLKKQLDDSNKNMIKAKAQHKSKVKDLTKQIEHFKKINDTNAEIVKLETENSKLNQKIVELEEEKRNLQLKIVKLDAIKDPSAHNRKQLEAKVDEQLEVIEWKNKSISTLEENLKESNKEMLRLKEMLSNLSDLENNQVQSEMTSIQFEEKIDKIELEKKELITDKENYLRENDKLNQEIEVLKKEKQEILSKLDTYMQENIELIDKLEKLSAEKVSSAESIEIVENLTQQEKLEIEAFQKRMDLTTGGIKNSSEHLESPELNESVTQLTEETSELLQKIELFTVERREVMEKMENLTQENNQLSLKLREVENNRDVLAETYERLQTEKEEFDSKLEELSKQNKELNNAIEKLSSENVLLKQNIEKKSNQVDAKQDIKEYKSLIEIQKQEIRELKLQLLSLHRIAEENVELGIKMETLEERYKALLSENEELVYKYSNENETIDNDPNYLDVQTEDIQRELTCKLQEIDNYKLIIEDNRNELVSSASLINDLQNNLVIKEKDITNLKNEICRANLKIVDVEKYYNNQLDNNKHVDQMSKELEELKQILQENIQHSQDYDSELNENSNTIAKLQSELKTLEHKIIESEFQLETKTDEINRLNKDIAEKEITINKLQETLNEKDIQFHNVIDKFKQKYIDLQNQIDGNADSIDNIKIPLQNRIAELEHKNKEQLEKMKKLAANLKKKTSALQELEHRHTELNEKWESELKEKEELNKKLIEHKTSIQEFSSLEISLNNKVIEYNNLYQSFNDVKNENILKERELNDLKEINLQLSEEVSKCSSQIEYLNNLSQNNPVLSQKEAELVDLREELENASYNAQISSNAFQVKIQELEMFIESQESELNKYKEKVNKLVEGLAVVEKRKLSLEQKTIELGSELAEKSSNYEEMSLTEDMLEQRLSALKAHDESIAKHLQESTKENQYLLDQNRSLLNENDTLQKKFKASVMKMNEYTERINKLVNLESENAQLKTIINDFESKLKTVQSDYDRIVKVKRIDDEKMDAEIQEQLVQFDTDKKNLTSRNEVLEEELRLFKEKIDQQQNDFENKFLECEKMKTENNQYLVTIEQQQLQLNSLQENLELLQQNFQIEMEKNRENMSDLQSKFDEAEKEKYVLDQQNKNLNQVYKDCLNDIENLKSSLGQHEQYNEMLNKEKSQLLEQIRILESKHRSLFEGPAETAVNNIITEAQEKIIAQETQKTESVPTFTWSEENADDPFAFIAKSAAQLESKTEESKVEKQDDTKEEINQKMKTLEFMLFSMEKEKDDALLQCHELSNELTRLVYERESKISDLESQVISAAETIFSDSNRRELHNLEYEKTSDNQVASSNPQPVVEDVIEAKAAYLCYSPEEENAPSTSIKVDTFGENDDGWGFGIEEVKLEQAHREHVQNEPDNFETAQLKENIRVLELEREHHLEEIRQSQVKSGKLIKKLKEFKLRNEQLTSQLNKKSGGFPDLDDAIRDELKTQVDKLEKKIKDLYVDFEKEKREKDGLLKRLDVLSAANDRMVEMKEKQDIEVMSWQQQNRELQLKFQQLEWGDDAFDSPRKVKETKDDISEENKSELQDKIKELNDVIKDLTLDNEDLQALLEEQRNLRINAEKSKSVELSLENMRSETEYLNLLSEKNELSNQIAINSKINEDLQNEIISIKRHADGESTKKIEEITKLKSEIQFDNKEKVILLQEFNGLEKQKNDLIEQLKAASNQNSDLENLKNQHAKEKNLLTEEIQKISNQNRLLLNQLEDLNRMKLENQNLLDTVEKINQELSDAVQKITEKDEEFQMKLSISIETLNREWNERVDQRGSDVAESWKLHLETRENEFAQMEHGLKKEISELEEKCNALANENNELRKNVDSEIRNEVDRISALQQQINDLTNVVQEKQMQINDYDAKSQVINQTLKEKAVIIIGLENSVTILQDQIKEKHKTIEELTIRLENKESDNKIITAQQEEIASHKASLVQFEDELMNKQNVLGEQMEAIDNFQKQLNDYSRTYSTMEQQLNEKDLYISEISYKLQEIEAQKHKNSSITTDLNNQVENYEQQITNLNIQLQEYLVIIETLKQELRDNSQINESDIFKLQSLLTEKGREHEYNLRQHELATENKLQEIENSKQNLLETEVKYEELLLAKDEELKNLQEHLDDAYQKLQNLTQENELYGSVAQELQQKSKERDDLQLKLSEQNILHDEETKQLIDIREIIEEQVVKIEDLQKELYEKSRDYDSLVAQITIPDQSRNDLKLQETKLTHEDNSISNPERAELDLALYMLHQRDVRCEELTVELMQLLEERDTLQLRLSNALREKEDLRSKCEPKTGSPMKDLTKKNSSPTGAIPKSKASAILLGATGTELATEATEFIKQSDVADPLANKLSELKTVGYHKDKSLIDEQDFRRLQQLSILQQHKDEVLKLPPEAAARLVDASYTLSRDVQSTPKVLLNWLWGRSTPKVNDV